jgi:hypothetical protein
MLPSTNAQFAYYEHVKVFVATFRDLVKGWTRQ